MSHKIKPGVVTGEALAELFAFAKEKGFAMPAVNCTGSNTINAVLETAGCQFACDRSVLQRRCGFYRRKGLGQ